MKTHELKLDIEYFDDVRSGLKTFEIRKNDRDFRVGDKLELKAYNKLTENYLFEAEEDHDRWYEINKRMAENISATITYMTDYAQKDGYVVLGIRLEEEEI